jgi:hypothetical protein
MSGLKSLFPRRETAKSDDPKAAGEGLPLAVPAYYEVWGSLESANRALWVALWVSTTVAFLSLILLKVILGRPPVVIRLDENGQSHQLTNSSAQPPVGEAEVKNFLTLFERFFTELNAYTCDSDLKIAFAMMTKDFQSKAGDMLKRGALLEKLKANQGKTTLTLTEITITKDTPQVMECHVKGYREINSYKPDGAQSEVVFDDDVILRKVARSEQAPSGLLVEDFNESLFKK